MANPWNEPKQIRKLMGGQISQYSLRISVLVITARLSSLPAVSPHLLAHIVSSNCYRRYQIRNRNNGTGETTDDGCPAFQLSQLCTIATISSKALLAPDRSVVVWISKANYCCGLLRRKISRACSALLTEPIIEIVCKSGAGNEAADRKIAAPGQAPIPNTLA
jgi:hypothetical protein